MNKDMKLNAQAALGNIALTITTFAVTAFIIGPENPGYSTNLGPILGLLGFLQTITYMRIIAGSMRLYGEEDPLFVGSARAAYVVAGAGLVTTLAPTFIANSPFPSDIDANTMYDLGQAIQNTIFIVGAVWIINMVRIDNGKLSSWAKTAGLAQGYGSIVALFGLYFGVIPASIFIPAVVLFGIVLYPVFIFGLSKAFSNA